MPTHSPSSPSFQRPLRLDPVSDPTPFSSRAEPHPAESPGSAPWAWIESPHAADLVARLRAVGCPEPTIRDLVTLRLCRNYRNRLKPAITQAIRAWQIAPHPMEAGLPDLDHFRQTLFHELEAELEGALGECPDRIRRRMLGWPDPETSTPARDPKAKESKRIEHQYHPELSTLTRRARHRALTEEERARYAELVAQLRAALAEVLPPDELTEYWNRRSPAATYVIRSLPEAADERQFRAMVDLVEECQMLPDEAEFLRRYAIVGLGPEDARRIEQREATFRRRLEEVMGRRERLEPE